MLKDPLSEDMILEILTRASLETVGRCRMVSREWNKITYERSFKDLHPHRTRTVAGYFVQGEDFSLRYEFNFWSRFVVASGEAPDLSLNFLPGPVRIEACDCGILLCCKYRPSNNVSCSYYVCKPSTKEWVKIPNPKTKFHTCKIAMVLVRSKPTLHYRILRISKAKESPLRVYYCEIFDSNAWRWKRLADMVVAPHRCGFNKENPVVVAGKAFWFTLWDGIIMFDIYNETWSTFSVPMLEEKCNIYCYWSLQLTKHEGRLSLLLQSNDRSFVDIFVMEDLTDQVWRERERIFFRDSEYPGGVLLGLYSTDVALMTWSDRILLYRQTGGTEAVFHRRRMQVQEIFPFCSDFEPSNLKAYGNHVKEIATHQTDSAGGLAKLFGKMISRLWGMNMMVAVFLFLAVGYVIFLP